MASQQQKKCLYIIWGPFQRLFFSHKKMLLFISLYLTVVFFFPPYIAIAAVVSLFYLLYFFILFCSKTENERTEENLLGTKKNMLQNIIIRVAHGRIEESRKKLLLLFCIFQLKNQLIMLYRVCIILFLCASGVCFSSHMRTALYHSYVHKNTSY